MGVSSLFYGFIFWIPRLYSAIVCCFRPAYNPPIVGPTPREGWCVGSGVQLNGPMRLDFHRPAALLAAGLALMAVQAGGEDGIAATHHPDGRTIYVNAETPSNPGAPIAQEDAAPPARMVYWSNIHHRWVPVPRPTRAAYRSARTAAREVNALVQQAPAQSAGDSRMAQLSPDMRAMASGRRISQPEIDAAIDAAAARNGVDPNLVRAIIKVESNYNPHAVSRKGAMGLMQLMPGTARELQVSNPYDVQQNVDGGVRHIKNLLDNFNGDVRLTAAAYNAGQGAVERNGGVPPYKETREYVKKVTSLYGSNATQVQGTRTVIRKSRDADGHWVFTSE